MLGSVGVGGSSGTSIREGTSGVIDVSPDPTPKCVERNLSPSLGKIDENTFSNAFSWV